MLMLTNCLNVFDHFVGLALEGLREANVVHQSLSLNHTEILKRYFGNDLKVVLR